MYFLQQQLKKKAKRALIRRAKPFLHILSYDLVMENQSYLAFLEHAENLETDKSFLPNKCTCFWGLYGPFKGAVSSMEPFLGFLGPFMVQIQL